MQHFFEMFFSTTVVSVVGENLLTAPVGCASSHDPGHDHRTGGIVPPDGGALEHKKASGGQESAEATASLAAPVLLTRGSLFFTSRTIFTDSSSSSSSRSSGSGGSTGSKFF